MSHENKYHKSEYEVKEGVLLFHNALGDVNVQSTDDLYIHCYVTSKGVEMPFLWRDMGKVLFFSRNHYRIFQNSPEVQEEYKAYQNVGSKSETNANKLKEDAEFFKDKSYHEKELHNERKFFKKIEKEISSKLDNLKANQQGLFIVNNGNSESYDADIRKKVRDIGIQVEKHQKIFKNPYFAKIQLKDGSSFYIGNSKYSDCVVDSKDKKYAPLYYKWEYHKDKLDIVRNIIIKAYNLEDFKDQLNLIGEEAPVILDALLARIIEYYREENDVVNIAQTIQAEQYEIIERPSDENILVEGCAGSGKTMILLHRISSIIFNESDKYNPEDLIIISPNNVLDNQSKNLLVELDISDTTKGSIRNLYIKWIREYISKNRITIGEYSSLEKPIHDNTQTYGDVINVLYQEDIAEDFDDILRTVLNNPLAITKGFNFISEEAERIAKLKEETHGGVIPDSNKLFLQLNDIAEDYRKVCESLSRVNVEMKLKNITERGKIAGSLHESIDKAAINNLDKNYSIKSHGLDEMIAKKKGELSGLFESLNSMSFGGSEFEAMLAQLDRELCEERISSTIEEISSLQREKEKITKDYEKERKELYNDREINSLRKQYKALKILLDSGDLRGNVVETRDGNIYISDQLYKEAYDLYDTVIRTVPKKIVDHNKSLGKLLHNNWVLFDKIDRYKRFLAGDKRAYIVDLIECIIWFHKKTFDVRTNEFYEFELYYMLRGLQLQYGSLNTRKKVVSVDEYQDYSPIEIELISKVFPNSAINLYGEILQNINEKGVVDTNNRYYKRCTAYKLDINYRNGKEITEYINRTFNTSMKPVGISSAVNEVRVNELSWMSYDGKRRIALIVKSLDEYDELTYNKSRDNVFINDETELDRNKLNIIPIKLAKGLEFEVAYVYSKNMTRNENYVACSRALEELNIVK